jgi:hypothetical protein
MTEGRALLNSTCVIPVPAVSGHGVVVGTGGTIKSDSQEIFDESNVSYIWFIYKH